MALNIKNAEVERLAKEVAEMAHETKTEAIRRALEERKIRLKSRAAPKHKTKRIYEYLRMLRLALHSGRCAGEDDYERRA